MISRLSRATRAFMLALLLALSFAQTAAAQDEAMPTVLRDTEAEALFRDISTPLVKAANLDPNAVQVALLNDPEINAFVATGQTVYIQSGLLLAADDVNQLQGVIAHELGHVAGGHSIGAAQGAKEATGMTIATMVLGAIAMAAGAGEAGMGVMMAGQRAAMGKYLAFTRAQESTADAAGASYLSKAGISGKGLLDFFGKLQNQSYRLADYSTDSYDRTHPLTNERIQALQQKFEADASWKKPPDPALNARFLRVKAKLLGFVDPKQAITKYPESDQSVPGHYARAYAYHVSGYHEKALSEANSLLATNPGDPYFLELKGQILLESGKPNDAIAPLRQAAGDNGDKPLISAMLGHALVATDDPANYAEAKQILRTAIGRDNDNPDAWFQLGMIYEREGDQARAALATAERMSLEGDTKMALASAQMAMKGIPQGTPDFLRAQDIAMVSCAELSKDRKEKKFDRCSK
jgi:predicted Zn-dependent protease